MKQALITPNEACNNGYRVAQVEAASFPVAEPLFWRECADDVVADQWHYDPTDQTIKLIPS